MKTQKNSVRRSLVVSATALVVSVAMLIGTTFAWFTDSVSSGTNKIVAGNLDVELEYLDNNIWKPVTEDTQLFSAVESDDITDNLWEPNHTEVAYLRIRNAGTLALNYTLNVTPINEVGGISAKDGKPFKLSDYLVFGEAEHDTKTTYATRADAQSAAGNTRLDQGRLKVTGKLSAETENTPVYKYLNLVIYMPQNVGNEANYKAGTTAPSIDFGITLYATQAQEEKDSFGNNYDQNADLSPDNIGKDNVSYDYTAQVNQTATITRDENKAITNVGGTGATLNDDSDTITLASDAKVDTTTPVATAIIPTAAVADTATEIKLSVVKTNKPDGVTVNSDKAATSLEVKVEGVKNQAEVANNLIQVKLFVGKNLQGLKMYHDTTPMTENSDLNAADTYSYDASTGFVTIAVDHFSPFTAVYNSAFMAFKTAMANGGTYTIDTDLKYPAVADSANDCVVVQKPLTLNLNATVTSPDNMGNNNYNFVALYVNADTTINAENGGINTGTNGGYGINVNGGATLTINGGNYYGGGTAVQVQKGTLIINGGTFACEPYDDARYGYKFLINCVDSAYKDGTAKIIIKGGTFENFDPSDSESENPHANFVADGYKVVSENKDDKTYYTVVKAN